MRTSGQQKKNTNTILSAKSVSMKSDSVNGGQSSTKFSRQKGKLTDPQFLSDGEDRGTSLIEPVKEVSRIQPDQVLKDSLKINLQLFPINDATRSGLQKDGHNPYLELILRARKKISSVIKHLHTKWGNSSVANGELMLFPYEAPLENLVHGQRWTAMDMDISSGDVYLAIGSPSIFRLRYGWIPGSNISDDKQRECVSVWTNQEQGMIPSDNSSRLCLAKPTPFPVKLKTDNSSAHLLDEGLSNISFRDLLAKVAPATSDINQSRCLPIVSTSGASQIPFCCDSFDAAIASHIARHQTLQNTTQPSNSSFWVAEDACHGFLLPKTASVGKEGTGFSGNADVIASCSESLGAQKVPDVAEIGNQPVNDENIISKEISADLKPHKVEAEATNLLQPEAQVQNINESSLGLAGIHWDSLGPQDCVMTPKLIISSDSIGFSNLFAGVRVKLDKSRTVEPTCQEDVPCQTAPTYVKLTNYKVIIAGVLVIASSVMALLLACYLFCNIRVRLKDDAWLKVEDLMSTGKMIDCGVAYVLMFTALAVTYIVH